MNLILASNSSARRRLLENAGVDFHWVSPCVDEAKIKKSCVAENSDPMETAMALAVAKARAVINQAPEGLILSADQVLICNGQRFDKPVGLDGIREHLAQLSGQVHELINAVVIMEQGKIIWDYHNTVTVEMRPLTRESISSYINKVGEKACESVGAYHLEGLGIQLLHRVDGDFFSILGLPLFPLLEFLRKRCVIFD